MPIKIYQSRDKQRTIHRRKLTLKTRHGKVFDTAKIF